ncbi:MAG: M24 family metallopeptidase [Terriglobia bacterium]
MTPSCSSTFIEARQQRLRRELGTRRLPFFVATKPENLFYLTGFRGSAGIAIFAPGEAVLLVDPRYTLQAQATASGVEVRETKAGLYHAAGLLLRKRRASCVGFEDDHLTVEEFDRLRREGPAGARWTAGGGLVEDLRVLKDAFEVEQIRNACKLTARAFEETLPQVRVGISERDLASELDYRMRRGGAEGAAFETIVASGPRAALPHARPAAKLLAAGELVIVDLGAILGGYVGDMTRTLYLGRPSRSVRSMYQAVLEAQQAAIGAVRTGARTGDIDAAARRRLTESNLAAWFTHSTGHGVGIEVHERPRLAKGQKARLSLGNAVTVEPGVYIEGYGGIRIEDTVLVGPREAEILTPAPKDRWYVS